MNARPTTPSVAATWISIAALVLLGSACSTEGPVGPTAVREPAASTARKSGATGDAACVSDPKLIGRIALSTADAPGTWWYLTREGMDAAGLTNYEATMEGWFGREFSSTAEAISYLVAQVLPADANGNGYVCAYALRGTRAHFGDPNFALTLFGVRDDKHAGK
jgi:hypothetical protein